MDEKQLESQSNLLIQLGEPETWLETMWRASRRSAMKAAAKGDVELATRWRKLEKALDYANAVICCNPLTDTPKADTPQPKADNAA